MGAQTFGIVLMASVALAIVALAVFTAPRCTPKDGAITVGGMLVGGCR